MNRGWQVIYNSMNKNRESKSKNEAEQTLLKKKKTLHRREMVGKAEDEFYFNIKCK